MPIEIKRLNSGDELLAIRTIEKATPVEERSDQLPTLQHIQNFLAQDTNYLIIATDGDLPVAFLTAYRMPMLGSVGSMVYLFEINVMPAYQRQGIGKGLINLLKAECQTTNVAEIWVGTENDNVAAKQLYTSTGGICHYPDSCEFIYHLRA
jgi:ribosomal protein S18 acetylase RimI-like enzyme